MSKEMKVKIKCDGEDRTGERWGHELIDVSTGRKIKPSEIVGKRIVDWDLA
jgi:hypothetical protein